MIVELVQGMAYNNTEINSFTLKIAVVAEE